MADGASMRPTTAAQATVSAATASGPTTDPAVYDGRHAYDYVGVVYDAATFTPGAPTMTPA